MRSQMLQPFSTRLAMGLQGRPFDFNDPSHYHPTVEEGRRAHLMNRTGNLQA